VDLFKKTRDARVEDALCLKKNSSPLKTVTCTAVSRGEVSSRDSKYIILSFTTKTREKERDREERKRERAHLYSSPRSRRPRVLFKKACDRFCADVRRTTTTACEFYAASQKKELKKSIFQTSGGQSVRFFRKSAVLKKKSSLPLSKKKRGTADKTNTQNKNLPFTPLTLSLSLRAHAHT